MSLKPEGISPVPEETARIAHAAYSKGSVFMHMRDELGTIYQDEIFAPLFSHTGQPAEAPWRLALVTIMQFARSAFLIGRPLMRCAVASIGSMLLGSNSLTPALMLRSGAEFRTRLVEGRAEEQLLTVMLTLFKERGWRNRPWQTADGFHACPGQDPRHQSTGLCGRNATPCVELSSHRGS